MKIFEFTETTFDVEKRKNINIADWSVVPSGLHNNSIIIQKITPTTKKGDIIKKVIKVEDCDEYIFRVLKTKIKAIGGAEGLVNWMLQCQKENFMMCKVKQVLNYAWDEMKYYYL